jgi:GMP synthase (glutamine-hydrolysing)
MHRMLVLKMGSTLPSLKSRRGDFDDWVIAGLGLPRTDVAVVDAAGDPLPPVDGPAGIVVTGSHTMVTERQPWSERAAAWLRDNVRAGVPVLGICYGHQLLGHALGGVVGNNPNGREFGTVEVAMADTARDDALLGTLPEKVRVHVGHTQSILQLPPGAVRLASNPWDGNQAVRFSASAWGVQFHPEFDADIIREYIMTFETLLRGEGQDTDALRRTAADTPFGGAILRQFARLATRQESTAHRDGAAG